MTKFYWSNPMFIILLHYHKRKKIQNLEISITTYCYAISKISEHFNSNQQKNFIVSVFLHSFFHKNIENSKFKNNQYYFSHTPKKVKQKQIWGNV